MRVAVFIAFLACITTAYAQRLRLPCEITDIAVAADSSGIWVACSSSGNNPDKRDVYWITPHSVKLHKLSSNGIVGLFAAPKGARLILVKDGAPILFEGTTARRALPIGAPFWWSADARTIYFYEGASTRALESESWDQVGVFDLDSFTAKSVKLHVPTQNIGVCPKDGRVYSVPPKGSRDLTIAEYDGQFEFVAEVQRRVGSQFSRLCNFVGPEEGTNDVEGIKDFDSGKTLFDWSTDENAAIFVRWNPTFDSILLRRTVSEGGISDFQVFDVRTGSVLQDVGAASVATWSADGRSLIVSEGQSLRWVAATIPDE